MKKIFGFCALGAALAASIILYVGLKHNAMREFCVDPNAATCQLDYIYMTGIWGSWFLVFALPSIGISVLIKILLRQRSRS